MNNTAELPLSPAELANYHQVTANMYNFFSRLFHHELDEELYDLLKAWAPELPDFAPDGASGAVVEVRRMVADLPSRDQAVLNLATVYAKQFLGVHPEVKTVSLCQSVYTSERGLTHQDALHSARGLFRAENLELAEQEELADDHLSIILHFLGRKAAELAELAASQSEDQPDKLLGPLSNLADYRAKLLENWLPSLQVRADQLMPGSFYTVFLKYLGEFVDFDREESRQMLADLSV